jgi:lipoprotein-anchoring transpeptidase ErfK/SrfK
MPAPASKFRLKRRLLGGIGFFVLGGSAAAALSLTSHPDQAAASRPLPAAQVSSQRIAVPVEAARQAYAQGLIDRPVETLLNVPQRMTYGEFRWDDKGIAAGPVWVRVDLQSQIISVFRGGHEIGTAVILYGADGLATPTGKFPIQAKLKNHRSATYDAPMPYTLRLTDDGVSIHASNVRWGYATHGCIGVPEEFAAKLFAAVKAGDDVLIIDGKAPAPARAG